MNLDELLKQFYEVKNNIRYYEQFHINKRGHIIKDLQMQKTVLLLEIKQNLARASKAKATKIRKRLWNDLGVVIS